MFARTNFNGERLGSSPHIVCIEINVRVLVAEESCNQIYFHGTTIDFVDEAVVTSAFE